MSAAFIGLGRFDEAVAAAKKALRENATILRENPFIAIAYRCLASALVHLGREAEAREAAADMLELEPDFRISEWVTRKGISEWAARTRQGPAGLLIDSLRKAGFPE
jgi:adenylate cyclase